MNPRPRNLCRFRGTASTGALATLAAFGAISVAAIYAGPRAIEAGAPPRTAPAAASTPDHQQIVDLFASLVARSRAILAIHNRGEAPYEEIVLWLEDRERPGGVDAGEIALITHSRILQTVTFRRLKEGEAGLGLLAHDWNEPAFCEAWRTSPEVQATLVAAGISDLDFRGQRMIQGDEAALRITFTWAAESADGPDKASALVGAVMNQTTPDGAGEH